MTTTYIQFDAPKNDSQAEKDGLIKSSLKKALIGILTTVIPKANPDFDDKIDEVKYWLVECDNESGIPERDNELMALERYKPSIDYNYFLLPKPL